MRRSIPTLFGTLFAPRGLFAGALLLTPAIGYAVDVEVSGQVNRALMQADNGDQSETFHVDNDISGTRFRLGAAQQLDGGIEAGAVFETEFQSNASNVVNFAARSDDPELNERHMYVYFEGGFGNVSLGQGDGAANGGTEVDLSGTSVAQNSLGTTAIGGAINFGGSALSLGDVISNQDFESRYDRLRYETPAFGRLTAAVSTGVKGNDDVNEAALNYGSDLAAGRIAAAVGFSDQDSATGDDETVGGSVSWLAPSGVSLTYAYSRHDAGAGPEGTFNYFKAGYRWGPHAASAAYALGEDQAAGVEADMVGLAYVYRAAEWAELYTAAKETSLDQPGADDVRIVLVGTRLKF